MTMQFTQESALWHMALQYLMHEIIWWYMTIIYIYMLYMIHLELWIKQPFGCCSDIHQASLIMTLAINEFMLPHLSSFASSLRALEETTTWHSAWVKAKDINIKSLNLSRSVMSQLVPHDFSHQRLSFCLASYLSRTGYLMHHAVFSRSAPETITSNRLHGFFQEPAVPWHPTWIPSTWNWSENRTHLTLFF